ncbi:hypothetical protein B0H14DRAFT_2646503 [Mycena olivaceomarginata]|nr:hypothetical protein B0H14DRAFT_2646503 [Mycena olivaceomarginata]
MSLICCDVGIIVRVEIGSRFIVPICWENLHIRLTVPFKKGPSAATRAPLSSKLTTASILRVSNDISKALTASGKTDPASATRFVQEAAALNHGKKFVRRFWKHGYLPPRIRVTEIASSDFHILAGAVAFTKHYTEDIFFEYPNKTVALSFRYLDHPLVAHIVPYIRRPSRRTTVSPEYLAAIVRRALPIFETHFKNYREVLKSPLLGQFISALYGLSKLLPDELALVLNQLILPDSHTTNIQLPINFELPTFPSLPKNTPLETYEYSDDERLAMFSFNDAVFKHIFPLWRRPEIIQETPPDHIPALFVHFRLGISAFLLRLGLIAQSQSFAPIVVAAIQNTALAVKMFPQDAETQSWLAKLPEISENQELEFPVLAFPLSESVHLPPKWRTSTSDPSLPESTSSMSPRSPGSSTRFLGHEAIDDPRSSFLYTLGEDTIEEDVVIKHHPLSHARMGLTMHGMMSADPTSSFSSVMGMSEAIVAAGTETVHTPDQVNEIPVFPWRISSCSTRRPILLVRARKKERTYRPSNENLAHNRLLLKETSPHSMTESFVVDHQREKLYSYGGVRPYDKSLTPTSDFHCLDLRTMEWQNIGPSLRFRPIADPCLTAQSDLKKLPALMEPASAIISVSGGTYMFLFGGHDPESQGPTANLIAIDLDLLIWWYADVNGTPIVPRINQLFIFGGRSKSDDDSPGIATYSVAVYDPQTQWTWTVSDGPMPPDLPPLGYGIQAIPIDDGEQILLTRGWVENTEVPHNDTEDVLVPEIWQYFLPPIRRIRCLNLRETFWDLNLDLQSFVTVGNRMLLFGSEEGHDDEADAQDDDETQVDRHLPRWDIAIEISATKSQETPKNA